MEINFDSVCVNTAVVAVLAIKNPREEPVNMKIMSDNKCITCDVTSTTKIPPLGETRVEVTLKPLELGNVLGSVNI